MIVRCLRRRPGIQALPRCRAIAGPLWTGHHRYQCQTARYASNNIRHSEDIPLASHQQKYEVFERFEYPALVSRTDPKTWIRLLERLLPPHLQQQTCTSDHGGDAAIDIAQILIAAQRVSEDSLIAGDGVDLLFHLGLTEDRWEAVIWTVKVLVERFGGSGSYARPLDEPSTFRYGETPLHQLTTNAITLSDKDPILMPRAGSSHRAFKLDELTTNANEGLTTHDILRRDCLGQIWRSLGHMTMACADEEMKPEILEIIAYLHHKEIMPASIYNQRPSSDSTAIQQPPTLRVFSSRILTSLSDAAWRAHEKVVVQEAKSKGGEYASVRPEIPGMAYRVRVAGLRPEVWMELILWSCLRGGWVLEGLKILRMLSMQPSDSQWRSLSWRLLATTEESDEEDWDKLDFILSTRAHSEITQSGTRSVTQIQRTVSAEVINAYVDAALSIMQPDRASEGVSPAQVTRLLMHLKRLLDRSALSLSTGTWDAILVRFLDSQPHVTDVTQYFERLMKLSPAMGEELQLASARNLPDYVMDGSAAVLGLFHRALLARIQAGDVKGAFNLFQTLQDRADRNKHKSIVDFLNKQQDSNDDPSNPRNDLFSSYFSGIDYPAFDLQIPATTLASFLDLVTDAKAYEFGKWLVHSRDLDGPVIPVRLYGDPALRPALIRFAAETGDSALLNTLVRSRSKLAVADEPELPESILQSFFDSQVNLKRWEAAKRILEHMYKRRAYWRPVNLAHVARIMLSESRNQDPSTSSSDLERAKALFRDMVLDDHADAMHKYRQQIGMMVTMIAVADPYWADYCLELDCIRGHYDFQLGTKAANLVLEGVVSAYGAETGRRVLELFWPDADRSTQADSQAIKAEALEPIPFETSTTKSKRRVIRISGDRQLDVVMYGGVQPDIMTVRIIFRKALAELRDTATSGHEPAFAASPADLSHESSDAEQRRITTSNVVVWTIRCLRKLGMPDREIHDELEESLEAADIQHINKNLPELIERAGKADIDDDGVHNV